MEVYIPSYNRAGKVSTPALFTDIEYNIVIPKSQYNAYREYRDANELLVIPDDKDGNIAKKRNAILDIMADRDGFGIVADDDIKRFITVSGRDKLSRESITHKFYNLFQMAYDSGARYVGLNPTWDRLKFREFAPFSFTKSFYEVVGIIEDGLRYDERFIRNEDADFYFQQLMKNRIVIRDERYAIVKYDNNKETGIGKAEEECLEYNDLLVKKWGSDLVRLKDDGTIKNIKQAFTGV